MHRPLDGITLVTSAVSGDTTTHGLIRMGDVIARDPDWILFFIGVNDARTQGPKARKTLVDARETASNLEELRTRAAQETKARRLWLTPAAVMEERVPLHWALSRFGVRFRNEDIARVAQAVHALGEPTVDLLAILGLNPPPELFVEVLRAWSRVS
jgi:acyl-CoA thioesterase-1